MKFNFANLAASAVLSVAAITSAHAGLVQVNETNLGLGDYVVNGIAKLNGGYSEVITVDPLGSYGPTSSFGAAAFASFGQYYDANNDVISAAAYKTSLGIPGGYTLFAVFNSTGYVSSATSFTGLTGSFTLYAVAGAIATANLDPTSGYTAAGYTLTDVGAPGYSLYTLATSNVMLSGSGDGIGSPSTSFKFLFDEASLTDDGKKFFTDPVPFYMTVNVNGDIDNGLPATGPGLYNTVKGDVSAEFANKIPEPGSLALMGLALAGLGMSRRRKDAAK